MSDTSKVLLIGGTGLLGPYLADAARELGQVAIAAHDGGDHLLDIRDRKAVEELVEDYRPDVLIHAAAWTDVDGCERDSARAFQLNRDGVNAIVESLSPRCKLVYISSDQLYPDLPGPHREEKTGPVNVYGKSKFAGEAEALKHKGALILRTNIFGPSRTPGRSSLSDFVTDAFSAKKHLVLFADIFFSPLLMATFADLLALSVRRGLEGIYNVGSRDGCSKEEFARQLADHLGLPTDKAVSGSIGDLAGNMAQRPRDMRMDVSRIEAALSMEMPALSCEIRKLRID